MKARVVLGHFVFPTVECPSLSAKPAWIVPLTAVPITRQGTIAVTDIVRNMMILKLPPVGT